MPVRGAGWGSVQHYRLYILGEHDHIASVRILFCASDAQAMAALHAEGRRAELWQQSRFLAKLDAPADPFCQPVRLAQKSLASIPQAPGGTASGVSAGGGAGRMVDRDQGGSLNTRSNVLAFTGSAKRSHDQTHNPQEQRSTR
ncbi:conserved hypothetical protein [uncultured Defluviicoccus sp.]|uniref:Uncharacterized protein n=1 Tax=metagenome TaxID=256318 RepID=A0A380T8N5_9ZZZZ|nr:conserved hypothetical protein [uncultured Defluviicoccus sp.]